MQNNTTNVMEYKNFKASIMEAERLVGDRVFELPPGHPLIVYHADSFKTYPENWMKGPGVFIVPVQANKGLWFDWRGNDSNNTAVIPTVKGCNPLTGMQTTGFHLERYDTKCPKHSCNFEALRFCPECGYKWPDRGYVSGNPMWLDGFRSEDGSVRQFFFTEDMMRDVATHMIGKENTVPAFGFAFYSPKVPRQVAPVRMLFTAPIINHAYYSSSPSLNNVKTTFDSLKGLSGTLGKDRGMRCKSKSTPSSSLGALYSAGGQSAESRIGASMEEGLDGFLGRDRAMLRDSDYGKELLNESFANMEDGYPAEVAGCPVDQERGFIPQKEVAVGAGARINQELPVDTYPVDSWKDTPDAVMTIYFVFQEEFKNMAAGGFKDFKDCKEGMLNGLPVG
jgi:hypothetical protein